MGYDLRVISPKKMRAALLDDFVSANPVATVDADLGAQPHLFRLDGQVSVEVNGPLRIEADDVPEAAAGAIKREGWLVEISVKGLDKPESVLWPVKLAEEMARASEGVVYDAQRDAVVWPPDWRLTEAGSGSQRIDVVELAVYFAGHADARRTVATLLAVLRQRFVETMPRRYGDYEPMQHRFEGATADQDFADAWVRLQDSGLRALFWHATRPCFGGSLFATGPYRLRGLENTPPYTNVSLSFDARPFRRHPDEADRLVSLVEALASGLGAFYAAAWVERNAILGRGGVAYDGETESGRMPRAKSWVGLPAEPTWLAWFGPPYAWLVEPVLTATAFRRSGDGILVRVGTEPASTDALAGQFPQLPLHLVARRTGNFGIDGPEASFADDFFTGPPSDPAEFIPEIGTSGALA